MRRTCGWAWPPGVPVVALTNTEGDLGEFFPPGEVAERTAALADVARGVLQLTQSRRKRAVADVRASLPLTTAFFDDAIHLSPAGSDRLAEVVFRAIKKHGL